jgi:hypothetical protein
LECCRVGAVVDNNTVVLLEEKYLSGRKIPSNIISKGVVINFAGLEREDLKD